MIKRMFFLITAVTLLVSLAAQPILPTNARGSQSSQTTNATIGLDATGTAKTFGVADTPIAQTAEVQQEPQKASLSSARSPGIPTARNVDHVGITVPDLNQALTFFVDVLGADVLWVEPEGYGTQRPLDMKGIFNVDPHSSVTISLLRFGPNINLELMEYHALDQERQIPKNSDIDVPHIAFFVDDIDVATAYLQSKGIRMLSGPNKTKQGPKAGQVMRYFLTPWGASMELVYRPAYLPYQKDTSARLYGPAPSWR